MNTALHIALSMGPSILLLVGYVACLIADEIRASKR